MKIIKRVMQVLGLIVITLLGFCLVWLIAVRLKLSAKGIISAMNNSEYYIQVEDKIEKEFENYLDDENAKDIISNVSVRKNGEYILSGILDNTVELNADKVQQEVYNILYRKLKSETNEENVELFAKRMSEKYIKMLIPVKYFSKYSKIYVKYVSTLDKVIICLLIIVGVTTIIMILKEECFKYVMISLYNIVVFSFYMMFIILGNNNLALGSLRVLVVELLNNILFTVVLEIIVVICVIMLANYCKYYKKQKNL